MPRRRRARDASRASATRDARREDFSIARYDRTCALHALVVPQAMFRCAGRSALGLYADAGPKERRGTRTDVK
jgi:hypothetical protein